MPGGSTKYFNHAKFMAMKALEAYKAPLHGDPSREESMHDIRSMVQVLKLYPLLKIPETA